jgi:hypothetical protein
MGGPSDEGVVFGQAGRGAHGTLFPFLPTVVLHPRSFSRSLAHSPVPSLILSFPCSFSRSLARSPVSLFPTPHSYLNHYKRLSTSTKTLAPGLMPHLGLHRARASASRCNLLH